MRFFYFHSNENKASGRCHRFSKDVNCPSTIQNLDTLFFCAKAKRQQQLCQGTIDMGNWRRCFINEIAGVIMEL